MPDEEMRELEKAVEAVSKMITAAIKVKEELEEEKKIIPRGKRESPIPKE